MKIAIVGAGISGLYLAWKLAKKGCKVTVFEKKGKIGKKVCSCLISERILEFIPESKDLIQNKIAYCLIHFPRKTLKINFSRKFFVMSHFELNNLLADLAKNAGAKIILNHNINSLPQGFDRIIGCDGANSIVRKKLALPKPNYRLAIQGFLSKNDSSNFVETWPTKSGFLWKIPRVKETEYGIIAKPKEAKGFFEKFLNKNNLQLDRLESGVIPQGLLIPKNSLITLCGDASAITKPWSGGGIIWSLIAAEILLKNFPDFLKYRKAMQRFFLPRIIFSEIATKMVYFLGFNLMAILPKNIKFESDFGITYFS